MALLESCFCCSLAIAAGFIAVYLLLGYLIAFGFEVLWLVESGEEAMPMGAVVLCVGYLLMSMLCAVLVGGLATRSPDPLLAWMAIVTILTFPEAGLVIYMSIQYWSIQSLYGMTELVCWLARLLANVFGVVIVHSLWSTWKEHELLIKRLHHTAAYVPAPAHNNAYAASIHTLNRTNSIPNIWSGSLPNNVLQFPLSGLQYCTTQSEFNASVYVPQFINKGFDLPTAKRAQSMMDLRCTNDLQNSDKLNQNWVPWLSQCQSLTEAPLTIPTYTFSLDRKLSPKGFSKSLNNLNVTGSGGSIPSRNSFFEQQPDFGLPVYYGPLHGPDFLVYKKQMSKNSLSNTSDDLQKYRDVAL